MDRRVRRTREALRGALLGLIAEKGYDAITVQEIVDRADVGRATFYKHCADKEDLLRQNLAELADHLRARMDAASPDDDGGPLRFSIPMLEHVEEVKPMFASLLGSRGSNVVQELFFEVLCELVEHSLSGVRTSRAMPRSAIVQHLAASFLAIARWWVVEAPERTARDVHRIYARLVLPGLVMRARVE